MLRKLKLIGAISLTLFIMYYITLFTLFILNYSLLFIFIIIYVLSVYIVITDESSPLEISWYT
jgi:hypothetical protein